MKRRDFLGLVGGAATAWPLGALAQAQERVRRIGVLTGIAGDDSESKARSEAFLDELKSAEVGVTKRDSKSGCLREPH